jgi:hypothetical protein
MTVFKAKQLKGKLIFSYEEDEWRYLCWTVLSRCFEEHDMIGPNLVPRAFCFRSAKMALASAGHMTSKSPVFGVFNYDNLCI